MGPMEMKETMSPWHKTNDSESINDDLTGKENVLSHRHSTVMKSNGMVQGSIGSVSSARSGSVSSDAADLNQILK